MVKKAVDGVMVMLLGSQVDHKLVLLPDGVMVMLLGSQVDRKLVLHP